jgi:hypothetical protein
MAEKKFKPNGCGGKGGWINPPEFIFHRDCNRHDRAYDIGFTENDRKAADEAFLRNMLTSVSHVAWFRRPFLKTQAYVYYKAVRLFGAKHFNYKGKK